MAYSQESLGRRLRRALCNGGWGWVALSAGGRCLWPSSRIPRRCRRLREAGRSGGVQPHHTLLATGNARLDTTGPTSLATPADSDEGSGTPPLWCERGPLSDAHAAVTM